MYLYIQCYALIVPFANTNIELCVHFEAQLKQFACSKTALNRWTHAVTNWANIQIVFNLHLLCGFWFIGFRTVNRRTTRAETHPLTFVSFVSWLSVISKPMNICIYMKTSKIENALYLSSESTLMDRFSAIFIFIIIPLACFWTIKRH